ncbi:MAG: hypothetical protein Q7S22_04660 [Candidatus Micrarchaeota archaeon]|nr:hypothetical protein [Candidatus Micrarchaeota archaeon]
MTLIQAKHKFRARMRQHIAVQVLAELLQERTLSEKILRLKATIVEEESGLPKWGVTKKVIEKRYDSPDEIRRLRYRLSETRLFFNRVLNGQDIDTHISLAHMYIVKLILLKLEDIEMAPLTDLIKMKMLFDDIKILLNEHRTKFQFGSYGLNVFVGNIAVTLDISNRIISVYQEDAEVRIFDPKKTFGNFIEIAQHSAAKGDPIAAYGIERLTDIGAHLRLV